MVSLTVDGACRHQIKVEVLPCKGLVPRMDIVEGMNSGVVEAEVILQGHRRMAFQKVEEVDRRHWIGQALRIQVVSKLSS